MPKHVEENKFYETYRTIRRDWGEVDPRTKTIPPKKQAYKRKPKYKQNYENYDEYGEE